MIETFAASSGTAATQPRTQANFGIGTLAMSALQVESAVAPAHLALDGRVKPGHGVVKGNTIMEDADA
ncbi:MAG: hypothetical protein J0H65_14700 [Rhizobiales bacterium]|nr:hypothetical protein [Hyphomicrobiales bacterium]